MDEQKLTRLFRAMERSYRRLEPFRRLTTALVEEYAGMWYGPPSGRNRYETLVNLMNQAVEAYTMRLAANRPRIMVTPLRPELTYFARQYELAINRLLGEIDFARTLRKAVLDAFFCIGIVKVQMAEGVAVEVEAGQWMDPGKPYAGNVALENWVYDTSAREYQSIQFAADWYRIPFDSLTSDIFDQSVARELSPTSKRVLYEGSDRLDMISKGWETDDDEYEPMIDLMDVWLPRERRIYTFAMEQGKPFVGKHKPLAVLDWIGAELGPYHLLAFSEVPENIMPASPASQLAGLARLANNLFRKQSRAARRAKELVTYTPASHDAARRMQRAADGDYIEVAAPDEVAIKKLGGVDSALQAFLGGVVQMFDRMAGNLPAMLGLGPQAETYGQEQLIHAQVSQKEAQMLQQTLSFTEGIVRELAALLWNDVANVIPNQIHIGGKDGYTIDATWRPDDREGSFWDYNFSIDIYSMPYSSPQEKLQALNMLIGQVYSPLAQLLTAQGGTIDMEKLTELYAELLNLPQLHQVVKFEPKIEPLEQNQQGELPSARVPREYIRRNVREGSSPRAAAEDAARQWMEMAMSQAQNETPGT